MQGCANPNTDIPSLSRPKSNSYTYSETCLPQSQQCTHNMANLSPCSLLALCPTTTYYPQHLHLWITSSELQLIQTLSRVRALSPSHPIYISNQYWTYVCAYLVGPVLSTAGRSFVSLAFWPTERVENVSIFKKDCKV